MSRCIFIILVLLLFLVGCDSNYSLYKPVVMVRNNGNVSFQVDESLDTLDHRERITKVLTFYDEKWKKDSSGKVYITKSLSGDLETISNYTKKANDEDFLKGKE